MNDRIIIIWGFLVILIASSIMLLGNYYNKNSEYIETNKIIKEHLREYIKKEKIKIPFLSVVDIDSKELKDKFYIEEIKMGNSSCEFTSKVKNFLILKTYKTDYKCTNEIVE